MRTRVLLTATIVALVSIAALPGSPASAAAGPGGGAGADPQSTDSLSPAVLAKMRQQEKLRPAVAILAEAAGPAAQTGLAGLAFEGAGLTLYWKGALSKTMTDAVTRARALGPVQVRPATYSKAELQAAAQSIVAHAGKGHNIQSITTSTDGSGLGLALMPPARAAAVRAKAGVAKPTALADAVVAAGVTVPIHVVTADQAPTAYSCNGICNRLDDTSPWNGGVKLYPIGASGRILGVCTSGFGVWVPALGSTYTMTAAHCATASPAGGDYLQDQTQELVGTASTVEDWQRDIMLINGLGSSLIFDGLPGTSRTKRVHSYGWAAIGEWVCQSGANSGTVCDLETTDYRAYNPICDSDGDCFDVWDLMVSQQRGGINGGQRGDSGAPVFTLDGDGVSARGLVHGGVGAELLWQDMGDITANNPGVWYAAYPLTG